MKYALEIKWESEIGIACDTYQRHSKLSTVEVRILQILVRIFLYMHFSLSLNLWFEPFCLGRGDIIGFIKVEKFEIFLLDMQKPNTLPHFLSKLLLLVTCLCEEYPFKLEFDMCSHQYLHFTCLIKCRRDTGVTWAREQGNLCRPCISNALFGSYFPEFHAINVGN